MTKREFLKTGSLSAAAFFTGPLSGWAASLPGIFRPVSQNDAGLLPFFYATDLLRLLHLSELKKEQLQALRVNEQMMHLGRAWNVPTEDVLALLNDSRDILAAEGKEQDRAHTQYALCAGHLAARQADAAFGERKSGESIALDAHVLRRLQSVLSDDPRTKDPARPLEGVELSEIEQLIEQIHQRNWLRTHTFRPEFSRGEQWIGEFLNDHHTQRERIARYASAYLRPDTTMTAGLSRVYDSQDPIIQFANALRKPQLTSAKGMRDRVLSASPTTTYGRQLQEGFRLQEVIGAYVAGSVSRDELTAAIA